MFCHRSCVPFNHLLVTCQGDQIACANQEKCIYASQRCNKERECSDGSDEECSKYCGRWVTSTFLHLYFS